MRSKEVLCRVKDERNIIQTVNRRKADWIGHILCRNCLLEQVIEGKIEGRIVVTGREEEEVSCYWMKETRRCWKLEHEALEGTVWRTGRGRGYGTVVREAVE
jgi:hypothetical protein